MKLIELFAGSRSIGKEAEKKKIREVTTEALSRQNFAGNL